MASTPRIIEITPKSTNAKTQYYDISAEDSAYIYNWLIRFLADMNELATHHPEIQREYFQKKPKIFPKGHNGPNSYASMIGGIISAKIQDPNRNLSDPQLDPIEFIFDAINTYYCDEPTNKPEAIKFKRSLFS